MSGGALTDYGGSSLYAMEDWAMRLEKDNPLLAEQMRDMAKLLGRYDYYLSGDIGEEAIEKAWTAYRDKWLGMDPEELRRIMFGKCMDLVDSMIRGRAEE